MSLLRVSTETRGASERGEKCENIEINGLHHDGGGWIHYDDANEGRRWEKRTALRQISKFLWRAMSTHSNEHVEYDFMITRVNFWVLWVTSFNDSIRTRDVGGGSVWIGIILYAEKHQENSCEVLMKLKIKSDFFLCVELTRNKCGYGISMIIPNLKSKSIMSEHH